MSRPYPPRDLVSQGDSDGMFVTWKLAENSTGQDWWRIYSPDENTLVDTIRRESRQYHLQATAGAVGIFVSAMNGQGEESQLVQATGTATQTTGAPAAGAPPPGFSSEQSGGGDTQWIGGRFGSDV